MKNDDSSGRGARPKRAALSAAWLVGAIILSIFSGSALLCKVTSVENSKIYYIIATGHYTVSLAIAFLVFSGVYFMFDAIFALSYRRALGWGHFGLMAGGALLVIAPSILLRLTSPWPGAAKAERAFAVLSAVPTFGYLLTLVGLILFAILVGEMVGRLRR